MQLEELSSLLQDLYAISGVRVILYDRHRHCLVGEGVDGRAEYCIAVQAHPEGLCRCLASDARAFDVAEKSGAPFVYTCPFGLFEAVLPLRDGERLLGFLFAGSAIEKTPNQREQAIEVGLRYAGRLHTREEIEALVDALSAPSEDAIGALLRMMERLGRYIAEKGWIEGKDSRAELLRIYLDRNLHRRITLSELGAHFHFSTVTLTEDFRRAFGCTVGEYLTQRRLDTACGLLRGSPLGVEAIAEKCGFSGASYFSKTFKRHFGVSPLQWRQKNGSVQAKSAR